MLIQPTINTADYLESSICHSSCTFKTGVLYYERGSYRSYAVRLWFTNWSIFSLILYNTINVLILPCLRGCILSKYTVWWWYLFWYCFFHIRQHDYRISIIAVLLQTSTYSLRFRFKSYFSVNRRCTNDVLNLV